MLLTGSLPVLINRMRHGQWEHGDEYFLEDEIIEAVKNFGCDNDSAEFYVKFAGMSDGGSLARIWVQDQLRTSQVYADAL